MADAALFVYFSLGYIVTIYSLFYVINHTTNIKKGVRQNSFVKFLHKYQMCYIASEHYCRCMHRLNLIAVVGIVAAVSLVVGMASPAVAVAFAAQHENTTMTMDNRSSIGNMTGGNTTSTAGNTIETDDLAADDVPDDDPDRTVAPTAPDVAADDDTVDNGNGGEEEENEGN